ncbi:MAG TPA: hypothetical protein VN674_09015 [Gemmatimonadales bacterium]|nr:hypothetical protein [Gemmatimonadales bacterium]
MILRTALPTLLLALGACETDHVATARDPFTMHIPEAAEIYQAVADDVFNAYGEGGIYLDTRRAPLWGLEPMAGHRAQLPTWAISALLSSRRFDGTCSPAPEWTCPIRVHGVTINVSGLFRGRADTVIVQVGQGSVNPPDDPHPLPEFGECDWYYLLKESGRWNVVKIEGRMIT